MKLLEVENLTVQYPGSTNPACKVSFQVESGELLGIAGASGAGKSTAMLSLMGILPEQVQITSEKLKQHGTKAMIFQDASASLNPLVRVGKQLTETILAHQRCTGKEARERAETLLDEVGIQDPGQRMKQYPFELSGGMKQRVAIAIALACNPDLIIADEPTTALDVTIQAQILDLLRRRLFGLQLTDSCITFRPGHDRPLLVVSEAARSRGNTVRFSLRRRTPPTRDADHTADFEPMLDFDRPAPVSPPSFPQPEQSAVPD